MVCAYVIGYPVTAEFMNANNHLKFAENSEDTGVIVSYNTQSPSVAPGANIVMANEVGLAIKKQSPFKATWPVTLAMGACGYVPMAACFARGGYETLPVVGGAPIRLCRTGRSWKSSCHSLPTH